MNYYFCTKRNNKVKFNLKNKCNEKDTRICFAVLRHTWR